MRKHGFHWSLLFVLLLFAAGTTAPVLAGGAWVPAPGTGDIQIGFSQKTAHTSWDSRGESFTNTTGPNRLKHYHDFRYAYVSGEVGVIRRLSIHFLVTYLDGFEGPIEDMERNTGPSDAWFGLKYQVAKGDWPMAIGFTIRTPYLYDLPGPYNRHLFDSNGNFRGVSPEWRGLLREDYTLNYLLSHSYADGRGWMNFGAGYSYRVGAPADEVPMFAEIGYPLPFWNAAVKGTVNYVQSLGNDSLRKPHDRFGSRPGFNFNNATILRAGVAFIVPLSATKNWTAEIGYNQWLMGRSARQYEEPFLSIGRRF